jgi:hypothetical protein
MRSEGGGLFEVVAMGKYLDTTTPLTSHTSLSRPSLPSSRLPCVPKDLGTYAHTHLRIAHNEQPMYLADPGLPRQKRSSGWPGIEMVPTGRSLATC